MKKELKSGILSADKSADHRPINRPTVGGVNVIAVLVVLILHVHRIWTQNKLSIAQELCVMIFCTMIYSRFQVDKLQRTVVASNIHRSE